MRSYIRCEEKDWAVLLTIDRQEALNALNPTLLMQLQEALQYCEEQKTKVIVITGAGNKAFAAGADIATMQKMTSKEAVDFSQLGQNVMNGISKMKAIVIAAVNGYALGGGCELAMACDFRIASENACFGIPEVSLGVIPGFGGTQRLSRIIGIGKAMELMATGSRIKAEEALRYGLINEVTKQEDLLNVCFAKAKKIGMNSAFAVAMGKQSVLEGFEMDLEKGLAYETGLFALTFSGVDQKEGMTAFLEKRPARFRSL